MTLRLLSLFFLLIISNLGWAQLTDTIEARKAKYETIRRTRFSLLPHQGTYLLPFVYNWMPYESIYQDLKPVDPKNAENTYYKNIEAEFQISFTIPIANNMWSKNWDLMMAYTHHAWWQVYNSDWSRPFRETNYMPELFTRYIYNEPKNIFGIKLVALDTGFIHQSNGQIQQLSRSWNRLFARGVMRLDEFTIILQGWYRIPERESVDDNKDIYNYMGLGSLELLRPFGKHTLHLKLPIFSHHFSPDIKYSYPWQEGLRWYASYQSGYGHSMIEYNRPTQRLGVGVTLENLFDER